MELHDENEFKIKSYSNAIFKLERFEGSLNDQNKEALEKVNGVGKSIAAAIDEINRTNSLELYEKLIKKTPEGVFQLLDIKGLGVKKIKVLWKEHNINTVEKLSEAIETNEFIKLKGFGGKTAENIKEAILLKKENEGKLLYAVAEQVSKEIISAVKNIDDTIQIDCSGATRRKLEVIDELVFVASHDNLFQLSMSLDKLTDIEFDVKISGPSLKRGSINKTPITFHLCSNKDFVKKLFLTTGSIEHISENLDNNKTLKDLASILNTSNEWEIYEAAGLPFIEPELREATFNLADFKTKGAPQLIEMVDLKGILHNHSTYSDGQHSLKDMALECKNLGYEYLGISDHSKSSFYYANGLFENRVMDQQKEIDELNKGFNSFKIFKGIECDILPDGSLDYENKTLASFDFIVSSIHSAMKMDKNKATERVLRAVENPFTTILGHMTGRLLLKREGYPVDHATIIEACAKYDVTIEINANPWRLDIDWRWVKYAIDKGVMLSINPDAHAKEGYADMYYGLQVGRKGGLTKERNLNSMTLKEIDNYFAARKVKALGLIS
jgi:DNA polymerase (family 10)